MTATISIRPRRQITLPSYLLEAVGANVGDQFIVSIKDEQIVLKNKKKAALDAFKALQKAVQESGIPEEELQKAVVKDRTEWAKSQYAK